MAFILIITYLANIEGFYYFKKKKEEKKISIERKTATSATFADKIIYQFKGIIIWENVLISGFDVNKNSEFKLILKCFLCVPRIFF